MRKKQIQNVIVHPPSGVNPALRAQVSAFHADLIRRTLNKSDLSAKDKIAVMDRIIEQLMLHKKS